MAPLPRPKDLRGVLSAIPGLLEQYPDDLGAVYTVLADWNALGETDPLRWQDLDGDGADEALFLLTWYNPPFPDALGLAVLKQRNGKHVLVDSIDLTHLAIDLGVPLVHDLTGDGTPELVVTYGAATADRGQIRTVRVFDLLDGQLCELTRAPLESLDGRAGFADHDHDGRVEIMLTGGHGWADDRGRIEYYGWRGGDFQLIDVLYLPSPLRVDAIFDGDRALAEGDYTTAIVHFERAAYDAGLYCYGIGRASAGDERRALEAFAHYRLLTVHAMLGEREAAARALETLRSRYAGHPFHSLAEVFWEAWQAGGSIDSARAAVTSYASDHPEVLEAFGDHCLGCRSEACCLASPRYTPEDMGFPLRRAPAKP